MSNKETSNSFPVRLLKVFSVQPADRTDSDLAEIMHVTSDIEYLKRITIERNSDRVHWECCRVMTLEVVEKGRSIISFGETGEKFYIILQGKVSVLLPIKTKKKSASSKAQTIKRLGTFIEKTQPVHPFMRKLTINDFDFEETENQEFKEVKVLTSGDSFGELALLNNNPRSATVKSLEQCFLAVLSQRDYKKILRTDAEKTVKERVEILKQLPIFSEVSETSLKCLGYILTESVYKKGQTVFPENSAIDNIYIVKSGEFKLTIRDTVSKPKSFSTTSLLRLKMMKTTTKSIDLQIVVKGKNQIFGYEEFVLGQAFRKSTCTCVSIYGKLFVANLNELKIRPGCSEIIKSFKNLHSLESSKSSQRLHSLRTVERLKQNYGGRTESFASQSSQNIQKVLHEMGKRHRPTYVVNDSIPDSESFSPRKSDSKKNRTDVSLKSLSSFQCTGLTPRIITKSKEIVKSNGDFLRNVLKKSGVAGVFRESYNDVFQLAGTCRTTKGRTDMVSSIFTDL